VPTEKINLKRLFFLSRYERNMISSQTKYSDIKKSCEMLLQDFFVHVNVEEGSLPFFAFFHFTHFLNTAMKKRKYAYRTVKPLNDIYGFSVCLF